LCRSLYSIRMIHYWWSEFHLTRSYPMGNRIPFLREVRYFLLASFSERKSRHVASTQKRIEPLSSVQSRLSRRDHAYGRHEYQFVFANARGEPWHFGRFEARLQFSVRQYGFIYIVQSIFDFLNTTIHTFKGYLFMFSVLKSVSYLVQLSLLNLPDS